MLSADVVTQLGQNPAEIHRDKIHAEKEFLKGMKNDAVELGDRLDAWLPEFKNNAIDVVISIAGDDTPRIEERWALVESIFGIGQKQGSAKLVYRRKGIVRPDSHEKEEQCVTHHLFVQHLLNDPSSALGSSTAYRNRLSRV
jgi:hypothetical protein